MRLKHFRISNFRNIEKAEIFLEGYRHFFCGPNGQGKTNMLEAIGMLTAMRSFRTTKRMPLIRDEQPHANVRAFLLMNEFDDEKTTQVDIHLSRVLRNARVDEAPVEKFSDFLGQFPTVVFSSEDIQLLRGTPSGRRRFFDLVLSFGDSHYLDCLRKYHQTLKQRNALLKSSDPFSQIPSFDQLLAPIAAKLINLRLELLAEFNQHLKSFFTKLVETSVEVPDLQYSQTKMARSEDEFLYLLKNNLERDVFSGSTSLGPHRDDFLFLFNGKSAIEFASEGQQRAWVLSLRFAQYLYFREKSGTNPVILADDILGELDPARRQRFWNAIDPNTQVIATGTTFPEDRKPWQTFSVSNGKFA